MRGTVLTLGRGVASLAVFVWTSAAAAAQPAPPELIPINDDTYAFRSAGYVSLFITTDEGVIVVDSIGGPDPNNPALLKAAIATVTDQPVRYLVYSHSQPDHGSGGAVFADTAEFVGHSNTVADLEARADPNMPVPTIAFDDSLWLELGGKRVELRWAGLGPRDSYVTVHYRNVLMVVDNIRFRGVAFADFPGASAETFISFIERLESDPTWDTFVFGHAQLGADDRRGASEALSPLWQLAELLHRPGSQHPRRPPLVEYLSASDHSGSLSPCMIGRR